MGSGNAGSTNMVRTLGWKAGIATFLLDIAKGAVVTGACMYMGNRLAGWQTGELCAMIGSLAAVIGHNYPIYYGFSGGKGVATTVGVLLVFMPLPAVVVLAIAIAIIVIFKYVSLGSMIGLLLCSACTFIFYPGHIYMQIGICCIAAISIFSHRENIKRLIKGEENKFMSKKK